MLLPIVLVIVVFEVILAIETRVELVQLVFRNGEQFPIAQANYPSIPHPWIGTEGDLTPIGERRSRRLGFVLRREYASLLGQSVHAQSGFHASCEQSARIVLAELGSAYPVGRGDVFLDARLCPGYRTELERVRGSPEVQKMLAKYAGLYRYVAEKTGLELEELRPDERLSDLYNMLEDQRAMNLSLPEWCPEGVIGLLGEVAALHYNIESYNEVLRRLNGGHFVRQFLKKIFETRSPVGMYLYAGTDHDVAGLARVLGKRFPRVPNHGSALILEKHRDVEDDRLYVRIMMWTGPTEKLFTVPLRGCEEFCPLEEFVKLMSKVLPTEQEVGCASNNSNQLNRLWS